MARGRRRNGSIGRAVALLGSMGSGRQWGVAPPRRRVRDGGRHSHRLVRQPGACGRPGDRPRCRQEAQLAPVRRTPDDRRHRQPAGARLSCVRRKADRSPLLFDRGFRGGAGLYPVTTRPVSRPPHPSTGSLAVSGVTGHPRALPSPRSGPSLTWSFDADWLSPRAYGSCYLQVPDLGGAFGAPVFGQFLPPDGRETVSVANAVMGLDTPLRVLVSDSNAPPTRSLADGFWICRRRGGGSGCAGGYVALSAQAGESASSAQVPYLVALSFVIGLLGEALLRFRWPPGRRGGRASSRRPASSRRR